VVEWPISDANQVIADIRRQVLFLVLGSLLSVLILAPFLARRITKPIQTLKENAGYVEKGDLTHEIDFKTGDEMEDLGKTFNKMTKGLKDLEELRNEFVYVITHELRSPITAIRGYVSFLRDGTDGALNKEAREHVETIWNSSNHLQTLVNDLLDSAKIESGQFSMDISSFEPAKLLEEVASEISVLAKDKKIEIEKKIVLENVKISADPTRFKQILANILSNAVKYNENGGKINIKAVAKEKFVEFSVEDNGKGIPLSDQQNIFKKYFRASGTGKIIGTGLGLYVTKQLVEKMKGEISFKSKEGVGTTFTFTLPKVI
jgi:signal transduction histidine kinase